MSPRQAGESPGVLGWLVLAGLLLALAAGAVLAPAALIGAGHELPAASPLLRLTAWLALALAALASAGTLRSSAIARVSAAAPWCIAVFVFCSATWAMVLWQPLPVLALAAVALAFSLLLYTPRAPGSTGAAGAEAELPRMYDGGSGDQAGPLPGRFVGPRLLLAGALLAAPAVWHPAFLGLLLAGALAPSYVARRRALFFFFAGAAVALLLGVPFSGGLERWAADLHAPLFDARLIGWNLAWFFTGRQSGALVYFLPLVVGLFADLRDRLVRGVLAGVALSVLLLVVLRPFDWILGPSVLAAPSFLPLYALFWFLPLSVARPRRLLLLAAPALALLWPLVRFPLAPPIGGDGAARYVAPWLARLPVEITQRDLPGVRDARSGPLRVRLLDGAAWTESVGALRLQGDRAAELVVISPDALDGLQVEFGGGATAKLVVPGTAIGDTAFHPDGRVSFELRPGKPSFELPMWWSPSRLAVYRFSLHLEGAPAAAIPFTLKPGRLRRSVIETP